MSKASYRDNSKRHIEDALAVVSYQLILGPIALPEGHFASPLAQVLAVDCSVERLE
ncbi:hypothetical protein IU514_05220 [Lysobacter niastensis]|uniref:Uncharacterized protein n=1 Tax=Lysobacter niastensis TaxID=380629 RepID=A0ABS0B8H8_9GAMM|nr:hypothetical protein [Lysobacter niastensis]